MSTRSAVTAASLAAALLGLAAAPAAAAVSADPPRGAALVLLTVKKENATDPFCEESKTSAGLRPDGREGWVSFTDFKGRKGASAHCYVDVTVRRPAGWTFQVRTVNISGGWKIPTGGWGEAFALVGNGKPKEFGPGSGAWSYQNPAGDDAPKCDGPERTFRIAVRASVGGADDATLDVRQLSIGIDDLEWTACPK